MSDDPQILDQLLTVLRGHGLAPPDITLPSGLTLTVMPHAEELSPLERRTIAESADRGVRVARVARDLGVG